MLQRYVLAVCIIEYEAHRYTFKTENFPITCKKKKERSALDRNGGFLENRIFAEVYANVFMKPCSVDMSMLY